MQRSTPILLALLLTAPLWTGCYKVQARVEMKKGNALYANESYKEALDQFQKGLELDPSATFAWRSVGLTALALFHPGDESPQNKEYADIAIKGFQNYLEDYPDDEKVREYLLTTYVNTNRYDEALAAIDKMAQQQEKPEGKAQLEASKIRVLVQADRLDDAYKLAQAYNGEDKAELLYTIGVTNWGKSYNATADMDPVQRAHYVDTGLDALNKALTVKPEYFEAMVYYNLLFREKAKLETDPFKQQDYIAQAQTWVDKAKALREKIKAQEKKDKEEQDKKNQAAPTATTS
jgi:tetratricopeptide (TPR) repeat protein